jgi:hypothetical protein
VRVVNRISSRCSPHVFVGDPFTDPPSQTTTTTSPSLSPAVPESDVEEEPQLLAASSTSSSASSLDDVAVVRSRDGGGAAQVKGRKFESAVAELGVAERSARAAIAADDELEDDALLVACQRDDRAPAFGGDAGAEPALDALLTLDFDQRADDRDGMLDRDTLDRHRKALSVLLRRAESAGPVSATRPLTETVAHYVPALRHPMVAALSNLPLHEIACTKAACAPRIHRMHKSCLRPRRMNKDEQVIEG